MRKIAIKLDFKTLKEIFNRTKEAVMRLRSHFESIRSTTGAFLQFNLANRIFSSIIRPQSISFYPIFSSTGDSSFKLRFNVLVGYYDFSRHFDKR